MELEHWVSDKYFYLEHGKPCQFNIWDVLGFVAWVLGEEKYKRKWGGVKAREQFSGRQLGTDPVGKGAAIKG